MPDNSGERWTEAEERRLVRMFRSGAYPGDISSAHGRTVAAVTSRLVRLGCLLYRDGAYWSVAERPWSRSTSSVNLVNPHGRVTSGEDEVRLLLRGQATMMEVLSELLLAPGVTARHRRDGASLHTDLADLARRCRRVCGTETSTSQPREETDQ